MCLEWRTGKVVLQSVAFIGNMSTLPEAESLTTPLPENR